MQTPQQAIERLLESYSVYFNISRNTIYEGLPVAGEAEYHDRSEKYVLVKKARLWAAEANEYVFFVTADRLDAETVERYHKVLLEEGLRRIDPRGDHMASYVSIIFVAEEVTPEAVRSVKKIHGHKDFLFSIHGWMDLRVAAVELTSGMKTTNRAGKQLRDNLNVVFGV